MERLKAIKECLIAQVQAQMAHLDCVDTEELGQAVDMLKDLEEALYYASATKAMEEASEEEKNEVLMRYYPIDMRRRPSRNMLERRRYDAGEMMYYTDDGKYDHYDTDKQLYRKGEQVNEAKGKYLKSKTSNSDKVSQMNSLEKYLQELASDMAEIVDGCSPEEKTLIHKKLTGLAAKLE